MSDDARRESLALAFLECFSADRDGSPRKTLADYLARFPGDEETIATEYLRVRAEERAENGVTDDNGSGGRIGPYRLHEELGRGGQGVVWLAEDTRLGRKVALKLLTGLGPGAESHLARFKREAALAARVDHPGICGVHDTGIEGGVPFIAMRYVDGETLGDRLARFRSEKRGADPSVFLSFGDDGGESSSASTAMQSGHASVDGNELDRILATFEKLAAALHAVHEIGVIHRDIKPGNIMLTETGEPLLLDFGLARDDSDAAGPSLTATGDLLGTPAYMSPEQITGRRVVIDRRSDVYSLGVTLFESLTLQRPFEAPTREALYQAIMSKEPERPRKLNRSIPTDLEVVLQCAMEKDRDRRYQTAADFGEDLRRVRGGEPVLAKKISSLGRAWRWARRRPAAAALLCALVIGAPVIAGLGMWTWNHREDVRAQDRARITELVEDQLEKGYFEVFHGNPKRSVLAFEAALDLDPTSVEATAGLARAHLRLGQPERALAVLERGEDTVSFPGALARPMVDVLRVLGRPGAATAVLERAPAIDGPLMWFLEGQRAIAVGHRDEKRHRRASARLAFDDAAARLSRAVLASPRPRRAYDFALAHALSHGDNGQAQAATADVIEHLWPRSVLAWLWSSRATNKTDPLRALRACREAVRIAPENGTAQVLLGDALSQQGEYDKAVVAFSNAIRIGSDSSGAYNGLGIALYQQGEFEKAIAAYREAIHIDPDRAQPHYNLGLAFSKQGKFDEAVAAYRDAIRIDPEGTEAHYDLGLALSKKGELDEAIAAYRDAIRIDPEHAGAHNNLGATLYMQGKMGEAVAALRKAIRIDPQHSASHVNLGSALSEQGLIDEAIATLREGIRIDPQEAQLHYNLALVLEEQGRRDEAITAYREALHVDPEYAEAHCNLGILLAQEGRLEEGLSILRRGHELGMKRGRAWPYESGRWLEDAYLRRVDQLCEADQLEEAIALLEEATRAFRKMSRLAGKLEAIKEKP